MQDQQVPHRDEPTGGKPNGGNGQEPPPRRTVKPEVERRAKTWAVGQLSPRQRATSILYFDPRVIEPNTRLGPAFQRFTVRRPSVLIFQDDDPVANFGHPCAYLLFDAESGEPLHQVAANFPPYPLEEPENLQVYYQPPARDERPPGAAQMQVKFRKSTGEYAEPETGCEPEVGGDPTTPGTPPGAVARRRFAILFAGLAGKRHLNDLELSYRILTEKFGYDPNNIRVIFHDGMTDGPLFLEDGALRNWPGSVQNAQFQIKVNAKGTREKLHDALVEIGTLIGENDSLFIHTEGHGGHELGGLNPTTFLAGYSLVEDNAQYFASDLQSDLASFPRQFESLLVLMNQCYAGGFIDSALAGSRARNTYVACAAGAAQLAYAQEGDSRWNDFSLDWLQAEMKKLIGDSSQPLPNPPQTNPDGTVSALGAFLYAGQHSEGNDSPVANQKGTNATTIAL